MMMDDAGRLHVRNPTIKSPKGGVERVEVVNPRVDLVPVRNRGTQFDPPEMHLGRPIVDRTPATLANLAISYLEGCLREASALPEH